MLSPLRLPVRHGPEDSDSTGDTAILEGVRNKDWERLGVHDLVLGRVIASWPRLSRETREVLVRIALR